MRYAFLVHLFGLRLHRAAAEAQHGPDSCQRMRSKLLTLEWLGAATRDTDDWRLTARGRYWLLLTMTEFFSAR